MNYKKAIKFLVKADIQHSDILFEDSLENLLKNLNPHTFKTLIYKKHGLKEVKDNLAEGYVIKPLIQDTVTVDEDDGELWRVSLKVKNKFFSE